jgi:hypothetical protein
VTFSSALPHCSGKTRISANTIYQAQTIRHPLPDNPKPTKNSHTAEGSGTVVMVADCTAGDNAIALASSKTLTLRVSALVP